MIVVLKRNCATDEGKPDPSGSATGAGLKSPLAAVAKSHGRERRRKRPCQREGQMSDPEMNASEPLKTGRKLLTEVKTGRINYAGTSMAGACFWAMRPPALRWHDWIAGRLSGRWEPSAPMQTERLEQRSCESRSREAVRRGGSARSSDEVPDKGMERRGRGHGGWDVEPTGNGRSR